ncbi:MAG: hypothetical protein Q7S23_02995 [bacterium]|nr:hypothetical protein [bacterium]
MSTVRQVFLVFLKVDKLHNELTASEAFWTGFHRRFAPLRERVSPRFGGDGNGLTSDRPLDGPAEEMFTDLKAWLAEQDAALRDIVRTL